MNLPSQDLIKYREYLESLLREKSSNIFTNGGVEHASVLMSTLFDNTKTTILMFSRGLNPLLTTNPTYYNSFCNYIMRGGKLSLMVETEEYANSEMFTYLKKQKQNGNININIKTIQEEDKKLLFNKLKSEHCNFSVFDNLMVRFEYDPINYKAFGSFNYPEMATLLSNEFNKAFDNAINTKSTND